MIGQTVGRYRIESQLGAGGMGVVYLAHDQTLERRVAVKVLGERLLDEPTARERFLREAKTASALNHPHVCTVHEVGEDDGQAYIVMEYVEGRPLSEALASGLLPDAVVRYGIQIADALAHAHDRGIVHRDLKTHNVIVTPEGRAKVLDFGLAKRLPTEEMSEQETRSADSLTEAGQIVGTLHYLSPEVLRGRAADTRTDVWALGVLLYELATGERPFQGQTKFEVTSAILEQPPRPLPDRVPVGLRSVIERCLAKEPGERYQRGSEARAVLEAIQSGSFTAEQAPRSKPDGRRWLLWGAAAGAVLALGFLGSRFFAGRTRSIDSIAVLPFANVGGNPETEYLSDGVTESVTSSLSRISRLKVLAFSSLTKYKGTELDPRKIGSDLNVAAVVTGRVEQRGDVLVIRADLMEVAEGRALWGQRFSRKSSDLLSVLDEISSEISSNLRQSLSGEERQRVVKHSTESSEAYRLYLKGLYFHRKEFTQEDYDKALDYYRQAIEKDPGYALPYTGLADLYASMAFSGSLPPKEASEKAQAAVRRAHQIDATLPEVHLSLAVAAWGFDWDWPKAEAECQRALELNPSASGTYFFCGQCSRALGRFDEAIARMKKAEELDPLSVDTSRSLGTTFDWARRPDEAIAQFKKALELAPQDAKTHEALADVYERKGLFKEAIASLRQAFVLAGDEEAAEGLGRDFESLGFEAVMRRLHQLTLEGLQEAARDAYVSPFAFASIHAKLGDRDQAFDWLGKAYEERSPWLTYIKTDPTFDALHSDPRFAELLQRVGLPP